jgi:DNA-binding PadR family transcriptional regulator
MNDAVERLTPLGLMILALLGEDDMHPYEMLRLLRQRKDDRLVPLTNGTMYHTVARLEKAGLLAEVGVDRDGNRPERTTYTLTAAGREAVADWVRQELPRADRTAQFRVALAEAHNLEREEAIALLRARRDALASSHSLHTGGRAKALAGGVPEQFLIEVEREAVLLAAELDWLDALIVRIGRHDFAWGTAQLPASDRYLAQREAARS